MTIIKKKSIVSSKNLIYIATIAILGLSYKIYTLTGTPFGWIAADFEDPEKIDYLLAGLAVFQFVLIAVILDLFSRQAIAKHNERSLDSGKSTLIPAIISHMVSSLIYAFVALVAFILLYDHKLTNIVTTVGAMSIGIAYIFRDLIAEVVNSVTIQSDRLISIGDWLEIDNDEKKDYLKVTEINHRMVIFENLDGYIVRVYNQKFLEMKFINLTKQNPGIGLRRKLEIQLSARTTPEQVLPIFESVIQFLIKSNPDFMPWHEIKVSNILEGVITYEIKYECQTSIISSSQGIVNLTLIRYLKAAGISLYRLEAQNPLSDFTDVQNRLLDSSSFGILKFLTEDEILALSKTAELKYFYEGKPVIQKGAQEDWMYIVSEGVLEVRILDQHGVSKVVSNLWPGDIVGEMSMLTGAERSADVFASKDSILLEISKENIAPILEKNPELLQKFSDILAKRQAQNEYFASAESQVQKIAENSKNIRAKIINFFLRR